MGQDLKYLTYKPVNTAVNVSEQDTVEPINSYRAHQAFQIVLKRIY